MSKRSTSEQVPKDMQARFDEFTQVTDTFSQAYLNDEYASRCRQLTATLCLKRPSPLSQGKVATHSIHDFHLRCSTGSLKALHIRERSQFEFVEFPTLTMSGVVLHINKQESCLIENELKLSTQHISHSHTSRVTSSVVSCYSSSVLAAMY